MGNLSSCRIVQASDKCEIERAVAGKEYPAGTCCVALSATNGTVWQLEEAGEVESRYAALVPKEGVEPDYLKVALDRSFPRFLEAHRTGINLKFEELAALRIEWHDDATARHDVIATCQKLDDAAAIEQKVINSLKEMKSYLLIRMFV